MNERIASAGVALFVGAFAWNVSQAVASGPPPPLSELKFVTVERGDVFSNVPDLSGAIDLNGASSVPVSGMRGVWGLKVSSSFRAALIEAAYLDTVNVGLQYEIGAGTVRDLIVVMKGSEAAQFGRGTGGGVNVLSKFGSDTPLDPFTKLDRIKAPPRLIMTLTPTLSAEYSFQGGNSLSSIYSASNGTLSRVAALGDPVPGRPGSTFVTLGSQFGRSLSSTAFSAITSEVGPGGVRFSAAYRHDLVTGTLTPVVENDWLTDRFGTVGSVDLDDTKFVFGAGKGLYFADPLGVGINEILPNGIEYEPGRHIQGFGEVNVWGDRVAFTSAGNSAAFVTTLDGTLTKVADNRTPVPGGVGNFTSMLQVGISDELVAFIGFDATFAQAGLFGFNDDALFRIAGPGDVKDGKTVRIVDFLPGALDHNVLAYTAYFTDGSSASYLVAVVPEPSRVALMAAGAVILLALGRRRPR